MVLRLLITVLTVTSVSAVSFKETAQGQIQATPTPAQNNPQEILPSTDNKRSVISKLKSIQAKQTNLINEIDAKIKSKLKDTQNLKVTDDTLNTELRMARLAETMEVLEKSRREAVERSQFLDRLIFAVDTKWTKNSFKVFLEQALLDIAAAEMNQTETKQTSNLWKFCTYLSVAVREFSEPREDLTAFVDNYMEFSTVLNPKPPTAFSQARSYTNGVSSQAAKVINKEELGDGVEKKLKQSGQAEKAAIIQGSTTAPLEPAEPSKQPMSEPNPGPTAAQK